MATEVASQATTALAPHGPADTARTSAEQPGGVAIRLLGPPAVDGLPRRRRGLRGETRRFLVYLALHPNGASRDELIAALWPEQPEQRARQRLYQAAADARSHLGDSFVADGDRYLLDRERLWIDVDQLERLVRQAGTQSEPAGERAALEQALALVRGEPLAGLDQPWADSDARRLRAVLVDLCERVAGIHLADGDPAVALAVAQRGIDLDQFNENLWRLALEAEGALGLRQAVSNRYETLSRILDEHLGLEPNRETRSLYLQLLAQD